VLLIRSSSCWKKAINTSPLSLVLVELLHNGRYKCIDYSRINITYNENTFIVSYLAYPVNLRRIVLFPLLTCLCLRRRRLESVFFRSLFLYDLHYVLIDISHFIYYVFKSLESLVDQYSPALAFFFTPLYVVT